MPSDALEAAGQRTLGNDLAEIANISHDIVGTACLGGIEDRSHGAG